jgi:UrcA family protein
MIKKMVLAAAALAAVPAFAQEPMSIAVPYGDLNLASSDGSALLKARVKAAARRICGIEQAPGLAEHLPIRTCRAEVFASAKPQMLAALNGQGSGSVVVAASR